MCKNPIILLIFCILASHLSYAKEVRQFPANDSLLLTLRSASFEDKSRTEEYLNLLESMIENSPNVSERYAGELLEFAINENDLFTQLRALNILGRSKNVKNDFVSGFDYLFESIRLCDSLNIPYWKIKNLNSLGIANYEMNNSANAIKFWKQAREIIIEINDTVELAKNYNNIGLVYRNAEKYDSAIYNFTKSIELAKHSNLHQGLGAPYINIATTYSLMGNEVKAISNYQQALKHMSQNDSKKSTMALKVALGKTGYRKGDLKSASVYLKEALVVAEELNSLTYQIEIVQLLSELAEKENRPTEALMYFKRMKAMSDKLKDTQSRAELAELEYIIQLDKVEKENKELKLENANRAKELLEQKNKANRQIIIIIFISIILIISTIFLVILLHYNNQQKVANKEMANLNMLLQENQNEIEKQAAQLLEKNKQIEFINSNLEARVKERTKEIAIKNEQLKKYAYSNSHHVRGPLARIMGLTELIRRETDDPKVSQFMDKLEIVSRELDIIIRNIAANLHTEFGELEAKK